MVDQSDKKNRSYSPKVVPWKAAETAERTDCPAGRVEAPSPLLPRPAPRLHAAENNRLKLKIYIKKKLIVSFQKYFSLKLRYKSYKLITLCLGRSRRPLLRSPDDGEEADAALPDAAPPGASSPGVAPLEVAPAAALDNSDAAAPRPLDTAVPAAAAAAPRLAVNAAPTAAPVLQIMKYTINTGTINYDYRSFTVLTNT
jgi:hypothetical protein